MPDNLYDELPYPSQSPLETGKNWLGAADVAASSLAHTIADVPSGLWGYASGLATGDMDRAADSTKQMQDWLAPYVYNPSTARGQEFAAAIPQAIQAADTGLGKMVAPSQNQSATELGNKYLGPGPMALATATASVLGGPEERGVVSAGSASTRAALDSLLEGGERGYVTMMKWANDKADSLRTVAAPQQLTHQGPATVNIGLNIGEHNGGGTLTPEMARRSLEQHGVNVLHEEVGQSATEPIYIAKIDRHLTPEEGHNISVMLKQDAIAQHGPEGGNLFGPQAEAWGPFNPDYFLQPQKTKEAWMNAGPAGHAEGREPLQVVHATGYPKDFTQFDPTRGEGFIHVGPPQAANGRVENVSSIFDPAYDVYGKPIAPTYMPRSIPLQARALNPVRVRDTAGNWNPERLSKDLFEDGVLTPEEYEHIRAPYSASGFSPGVDDMVHSRLVQMLEKKGYDSGVYLNRYEGVGIKQADVPPEHRAYRTDEQFRKLYPAASDSYLFWNPSSLKGKFNKTFDPNDPDFTKSKGGLVEKYDDGGTVHNDIPPVTVTAPHWRAGTHMVYIGGQPVWVSSDPLKEARAKAAFEYLDSGDTSFID